MTQKKEAKHLFHIWNKSLYIYIKSIYNYIYIYIEFMHAYASKTCIGGVILYHISPHFCVKKHTKWPTLALQSYAYACTNYNSFIKISTGVD